MLFRRVCQTVINALTSVNTAIAGAGVRVAAVFLVIMVAVVLAQVFSRYVLNDSLVWAEELSKAMMVWMAFLVAPMAMLTGANVKIEMLVESIPAPVRIFLRLLIGLATFWVLTIFFRESIGFWERGLSVTAASLPIPMSVFYSIVPIGFAALLLTAFQMVLEDFLALFLGEDIKSDVGGDSQ